MPVSGRINRKENLRSKAALKKSNSEDKTAIPKIPKDILKPKNTKLSKVEKNDNVTDAENQSELLISKLKPIYVCLEDFKLVDKVIKDDNNKDLNIIDNKLTNKTSRRKTKVSKEIDEHMAVENDMTNEVVKKDEQVALQQIPETPRKRGRLAAKVVEPEQMEVECLVEEQEKKDSKRGRPKRETVKLAARTTRKINEDKVETIDECFDALDGNDIDDLKIPKKTPKVVTEPMETESTVSNVTSEPEKGTEMSNEPILIAPKKPIGRVSRAKKPFVVEKDEGKPVTEMKIPGLIMLANVKNRKSALLNAQPAPTPHVATPRPKITRKTTETAVPTSVIEKEKIPGIKMIADIKKRKSELVEKEIKAASEKIEISTTKPFVTPTEPKDKIPSKLPLSNPKRKESISGSDKIPGLQTIKDLKERRQSSSIPTINKRRQSGLVTTTTVDLSNDNRSNEESTKQPSPKISVPTSIYRKESEITKPDRSYPPISASTILNVAKQHKPVPMSPVPTSRPQPVMSSPFRSAFNSSFTPQSIFDQKPPVGILSKPSPFKRPVSCLADSDDEEIESRSKISRRQSVTFNRDVQVKEIHGNSFNSASDESMVVSSNEGKDDTMSDLRRRIELECQRTKQDLLQKRLNNPNNTNFINFEQDKNQRAQFTAANTNKKTSDLSHLISARIKSHGGNNSPPSLGYRNPPAITIPHQSNIFPTAVSGSMRKLGSQRTATESNWKSFQPAQSSNQLAPSNNDSFSSQGSDAGNSSRDKRNCAIM